MRQRALLFEICVSCGLLLTSGVLTSSHTQEPAGKPDAPTPKTIQPAIPLPKRSLPASPPEKPASQPESVADLSALATSLAKHISVAGCQSNRCTLLVTDFTLPSGNTSTYGIYLADLLFRELASNRYKLQLIDRKRLQALLAKDRVSADCEDRPVIHWLSHELDARFIVFGTTETAGDSQVHLSSELIDTTSKEWSVYSAMVNLGSPSSAEDLRPVEPFAALPPITNSSSGEKVEPTGIDGTTLPSCNYMPNPPYSESAQRLKLSGSITVQAVVNSQGTLENIRIVRGLPGGLNETTMNTMRTWRCHPAWKDGKPVPVVLPFTISFRLY